MIRLRNLSLTPDEPFENLYKKAGKLLNADVDDLQIVRRSVDARKKNDVRFVYTVDVSVADESGALVRCKDAAPAPVYHYDLPSPSHIPEDRPVIVGFGPAGMFAGLTLALAGLRPSFWSGANPPKSAQRPSPVCAGRGF